MVHRTYNFKFTPASEPLWRVISALLPSFLISVPDLGASSVVQRVCKCLRIVRSSVPSFLGRGQKHHYNQLTIAITTAAKWRPEQLK